MNLHNPFALAGMAFVLAAAFWVILAKRRQHCQTAAGGLNAVQVIFLLSLAAMLVLAVLNWNDRAVSMPLLGSLLGSVISGLPLLQPAKEEKSDLRTVGDQSPSVRTDGKVSISYGDKPSNVRKVGTGNEITQGNQSPAIEAKKDVEIRYE